MPTIPLTKGKRAIVDEADYERLSAFKWHMGHRYACRSTLTPDRRFKREYLHHAVIGHPPAGMEVDHISGDALDNRRANLRFVTPAQNSRNRRSFARAPGSPSRLKGVYRERRVPDSGHPWRARILVNGTRTDLGRFRTEEEAGRAYDEAAKKHFGSFARLNFPEKVAA